jgi:amidase
MHDLDRRAFLTLTTLATAGLAARSAKGAPVENVEELTIADMRRFTARELTSAYLARIDALDERTVNAMIELNPDALAIADALDRERAAGRVRGPLHGIPIVIKDNIDTADRMRTSAGSLALEENIASRDAHIVRRLREAGAVIIGKTNLSEWANFRSTHSTSGWSGRGGLTNNPYNLARNACGSSTGSAVAVAANFAAVGVGTETDGSVTCPSSGCGIVGLKPTVGLVSRSGIIPISHTQDTAGPMARTVTDLAILLGAMTGVDSLDPITLSSRGRVHADYTQFLDSNGLRGARIGVARQYFGFNDHVDRVMKDALEVIGRLGATLVDPVEIATKGEFDESEFEVLLFEFKHDLNAYLATTPAAVRTRTLADLIRFNEENADREMPYFGQELFHRSQAKGPLTTPAYRAALAKNRRLSRTQGIDATMKKHNLDAMIAPTVGPMWPTDLLNGDHYTGGYSSASAVSGYPHITVPAGFVYELPVGLSIFAGAWSEPALLKYAYAFEQATKVRKAPKFTTTAAT